MPSGEMRRNTRVFCARVLRSGRRLWTGPPEQAKYMRAADDGEDWIELFDGSDDDVQGHCKENGRHDDAGLNQETVDEMETDEKGQPEVEKPQEMGNVDNGIREDRRWGAVYLRKRKRRDSESSVPELSNSEDWRYGKTFFRKQAKKRIRIEPIPEVGELKSEFGGQNVSRDSFASWGLAAFVESSCSSRSLFSCFLNLILRYMRRSRVRLPMLSAFLFSEPIFHVYSSHGIHFLQESSCSKSSGFCKVMGSRDSIPFFAVDFSALPISFMYLHSSLLLRSALIPHVLVIHATDTELGNDRIIDEEEQPSCITCESDRSMSRIDAVANGKSVKRKLETVSAPKLGGRTLQLRSGVVTRSIQKRRSSMRSKRRRNPSGSGTRKANGSLVIDAISKQDGVPFFPVKPNADRLNSLRRSSTTNLKELQCSYVGLTQDVDSASCSANILVIDSDKCYREEGAAITLEFSDSQQWFLVVKRNGIRRFMLSAQKFMRPCCVNRVTRAIIWAGENGWKLEFPIRQDWTVFKELYKKCSERSVRTLPVPVIPVPGVREVSGYADGETVPFRLPDSYITMQGDEVGRALEKNIPIYDMDSDDDEWLNRFNNESCAENVPGNSISDDTFELLIDTFERGIFCGPEDYTELEAVIDRCHWLAAREVVEAVHSYWMSKRQKRSKALVTMFEMYERRRAEVLPKAIFRKKRSFKRQPSQVGRGKQLSFLKAIANEREAVEEQNSVVKVQEANDAARRSEGMAVLKRQRAQLLMETADLATYKATMALRIADAAARAAQSVDASDTAQFFLGE